ncbi:hypothetical protein [Arenimonas oryziterrae]|uniref:Cytochrome c domain-containing protein n=1 Tax=Arenimonas oryziterrae DSM 21050 = YC6267 TaxID=1121015 RepID=A0A091BDT8_9GAMM|nr:hypothetical protein [Arenimonas oryziterrae]KFN42565.1 hypothetical protein N789_13070 [Arenimonas oryziterrae DSM 21050 = YC6267]
MDHGRHARRLLIGGWLAGVALIAAAATQSPLRAARWLPADRQAQALAQEPSECLTPAANAAEAQRIAIGRAAFRTPLLLGGQAARVGLSCSSCHRNGRGNPDFSFPGFSGPPGTADVTSSLMSSHRGDGVDNPTPIPDLSGPPQALKISRDPATRALENFIRGLIVEEFDGPEPSTATLDGLAIYVRALSPQACPAEPVQAIDLAHALSDARAAAVAAQSALAAKDAVTARLMVASARSALGRIDERYAGQALAADREGVREADQELAQIQLAIDSRRANTSLRITAWLAAMPRWTAALERDEAQSLFNAQRLATTAAN